MLTRSFWLGESGAIVRAIRTAAQTAIAAIGVGTTNLFSADIANVLALSGSAAILSLLMSLDRTGEANRVAAAIQPAPVAQPVPAPVAVATSDPAAADYQPPAAFMASAGNCGGIR
jgi:hypothetical protein